MIFVEYENRRKLHSQQSKQFLLYQYLHKTVVRRTTKRTTTADKVDHRDHGVVAFAGSGGSWSIEIDGNASEWRQSYLYY